MRTFSNVVDLLDKYKLPYIMMQKSNTGGHTRMVKTHGFLSLLKWEGFR